MQQELSELRPDVLGFIIMGDMNVHQQRWLIHSHSNTFEGSLLKEVCDDHALQQLIREPTREEYLLDLCLTDLSQCRAQTLPRIADHKGLLVTLRTPVPKVLHVPRQMSPID